MTSRYKPELLTFMPFKGNVEYSSTRKFTLEELLRITPDHLSRWLNQQAYGDPAPTDDMRPVHRRSSTLEFTKKAISSLMPRANSTWDPVTERGNPTRSDDGEVRREGIESKARRSVELDEFMNLLRVVRAQWADNDTAYTVGSVLSLQWHICARIDDMMKLQFSNFSPDTQYPSTQLFQMRWSKNIHEERDAPEQIILGSMHPKMCALLKLAVYIEPTANIVRLDLCMEIQRRRFLGNMVKNQAFKKLKAGKLGTHSLSKGAATFATRSGIVDAYIDNTQPYPNARTAAALTGPAGPCFYTLNTGIGCITPSLLVDQFAPRVKQLMGEPIEATLALPLLWAAMQPSGNYQYALLPRKLKRKIISAYTNAGGSTSVNPVHREEFYVTGDRSQFNLVPISSNEITEQATEAPTKQPRLGGSVGGEGTRCEFAALHSQVTAGRRYMTEVMNEVLQSRHEHQRGQQQNQATLRRLVIHSAYRRSTVSEETPRSAAATLSKRPKDLNELWHEYRIGCGGLKPAKDFTAIEQGANKFSYSRRKVFWDAVSNLVRAGFTSDTAVDKVYAAYGRQLSVSNILVALRNDRKRGGHPRLRV
ncbi:hypothetical protein PHYSODRAFT_317819 [Phytophthora sojae]|uniref:Uncharacterized protein n=1 Tax=Phytophthora sojae (strain P6497) TaxID=1094619 RepID=G5A1B1_PHYSP|nr:hypothetical protein PHYSODRAFT_317819 [Phytophthora sojae]EGZ10710.1 hypothetical protein PHYSODRAFT_317819 [Phytophthora sojae]|eukprot:XP_009533455.1 hypothetical protein PHYSODRAFT_317819 [Phytophthora sojae]